MNPIFPQPSYVEKHFIYEMFNKQTPSIGDVTSEAEKHEKDSEKLTSNTKCSCASKYRGIC